MPKSKTPLLPPKELEYTRKGLFVEKQEKEFENQILLSVINNMKKEINSLKYYRIGFYSLLIVCVIISILKVFY